MPTPAQLPTQWVSAAPFRYHVRHLMAATGLPWQVIAVVADLPLQQVRTLLFGRHGRHRPRLSPYAARRLLALDTAELRRLQVRDAPVRFAAECVDALTAAGVELPEIGSWVGLDVPSLRRLVAGIGACSRTTDIVLRLACMQRGLIMEPEAREAA